MTGRIQCKVCLSPEAPKINRALAQGSSLRAVSAEFTGVSFQSIARHSRNCLGRRFFEKKTDNRPQAAPPRIERRLESRITEPLDLEAEILEMVNDAKEVQSLAKASGDLRLRILAQKELRPILEVVAKIKNQSTTKENGTRKRAYEVLATLPDTFLRALRDGDDGAFTAVETAAQNEQITAQKD